MHVALYMNKVNCYIIEYRNRCETNQ